MLLIITVVTPIISNLEAVWSRKGSDQQFRIWPMSSIGSRIPNAGCGCNYYTVCPSNFHQKLRDTVRVRRLSCWTVPVSWTFKVEALQLIGLLKFEWTEGLAAIFINTIAFITCLWFVVFCFNVFFIVITGNMDLGADLMPMDILMLQITCSMRDQGLHKTHELHN